MSSHRAARRIVMTVATATIAAAGALVFASPAAADDDLVRVSRWCGQYVTFTNVAGKSVDVSYRSGVPVSPFPAQEGEFVLRKYASYTLKVTGSQHYGDEGTTHRLYYEAVRGKRDQDGFVRQWHHCGGLVKWSVRSCHVTFTNISPYRIWISSRDGDDYFYWDEKFRLLPGRSKSIEFRARVLKFIAERKVDEGYKRQSGTVYLPKKCKHYEDDDDDDSDQDFDPDFVGELILRLIPGAGGAATSGQSSGTAN